MVLLVGETVPPFGSNLTVYFTSACVGSFTATLIYTESYDKLVLSPGGAPIVPPIEGIDSRREFTVCNVADVDDIKAFIEEYQPRGAAVVGGGFIGIEMAENLKEAGLDVSVIELSDQVIAPLDIEMACDVHRHLWLHAIHRQRAAFSWHRPFQPLRGSRLDGRRPAKRQWARALLLSGTVLPAVAANEGRAAVFPYFPSTVCAKARSRSSKASLPGRLISSFSNRTRFTISLGSTK